jgi:hypothetical protein
MEPYIAKNWGWWAKVEDKLVWLLAFQNWCRHPEGTSTCCHFSSMLPQHLVVKLLPQAPPHDSSAFCQRVSDFLLLVEESLISFLPKQVRLVHQPGQHCILSETWTESLLSLAACKGKIYKIFVWADASSLRPAYAFLRDVPGGS